MSSTIPRFTPSHAMMDSDNESIHSIGKYNSDNSDSEAEFQKQEELRKQKIKEFRERAKANHIKTKVESIPLKKDISFITDAISVFLLNNNMADNISDVVARLNNNFALCKHEGDEYWKDFIKFFSDITEKLKGSSRTAFFKTLYPKLRQFLNSGISESNVRDGISNEETSRGGPKPKKFSVNAKCFHLTYDNTQDISLEDFMAQIFTIFDGRIKKWAVAHDIAPTTGMIHYHLYLELFDAWKVLDARTKFTVTDDNEVKIIPNIKTGAGTKEAISYIAKKEVYKTNMDMNYEIKTKKMHQQLLAYELLNKKLNMREAVEMYPELLFKYDSTKSNLNSYFSDKEKDNTPEMPLSTWNMFGIQTWFSGKGKTPQYWIVGPSNVGKTYNIDMLEECGHRPYLMPKNNDWSDWTDNDFDFMYNEETAADFSLTFLNQMLEGTRTKLNGKFVKSIIKKKNVPVILNSNHMPHMVYKNTDPYTLNATLQRMYIIYVDHDKQGHIIWNPNTMSIDQYISKFMNEGYTMDSYEYLFSEEYKNESENDKSYIKYLSTIQAENEERERIIKLHNEEVEIQEQIAREKDTLDNRINETLEQARTFDEVDRWFENGYISDSSYTDEDVPNKSSKEYINNPIYDEEPIIENCVHIEPVISESDDEYDRYGVPKDGGYEEFYGFKLEDRHLHNKIYSDHISEDQPLIDTYEKEAKILNNIELCYLDIKVPYIEPIDIKYNMGLCLDEYCSNIAVIDDNMCQYCLDEQNSDDESVVFMEYNRYKSEREYLDRPNYYRGMIKFIYKGVRYNMD